MHVTSASLAKILGVTTRRIQQLVNEGVMSRDEITGKYLLSECVQKYIGFKCDETVPGNAAYDKERALHERAKREKAELILAQMKKDLHPADEVRRVWNDVIGSFKMRLYSFPNAVADKLINIPDRNTVSDILRVEVNELCRLLVQYDPKAYQVEYQDDEEGDDEGDLSENKSWEAGE